MKENTVKIYARDLKEGDLFRVGFTDAVCSLNKISYEYGRVWVKINFYDGEENICNISGHDEVYKIIRDKYEKTTKPYRQSKKA